MAGRKKIGGARIGAGRPPLPPGKKAMPLNLTVRPDLRARILAAAKCAKQSTSAWMAAAAEQALSEAAK